MILGAGIDFPYWQTFGLQRVFPSLQDKLAGFPVATIYNRIIRDWPQLRPQFALFKTPDLYRKLEQLYGAYVVALSKGANRYQVSDRNPPFKTASFIIEQTGIDRQTVVAFLSSLEKLAKEGAIPFEFWDPKKAVAQAKAVTKVQKEVAAAKPPDPVTDTLQTVKTGFKWLVILGVTVGGAYALAQVSSFIPKGKK